MSKLSTFLGGALVGAVGLATIACLTEKDDKISSNPCELEDNLDTYTLRHELNQYFFKATALSMKCSELLLKNSELQVTPLEFDDDNLLEKGKNKILNSMTVFLRNNAQNKVLEMKKEAKTLYENYKEAFVKANNALKNNNMQIVDCSSVSFANQDFSLNNDLSNDNWGLDYEKIISNVQDFINSSASVAEKLITSLETIEKQSVETNNASLALSN